ncbi:hypothetical protein P7K49_040153, partial [Saguinus oedipus]
AALLLVLTDLGGTFSQTLETPDWLHVPGGFGGCARVPLVLHARYLALSWAPLLMLSCRPAASSPCCPFSFPPLSLLVPPLSLLVPPLSLLVPPLSLALHVLRCWS